MDTPELIRQTDRLISRLAVDRSVGAYSQVCEFLRTYARPNSSFHESARNTRNYSAPLRTAELKTILSAFKDHVEAGLHSGLPPEHKAQIDVISDILDQAQTLLEDTKTHPAAPAVLTGASLEEYLRTWVERENLSIGSAKPGIDAYSKALRVADLITKQDSKDITAWSGLRNHAAHGEWDLVADANQIRLMLQGVNLFMRKYTP